MMIPYPKISSLRVLKTCNAMNWPGGADISLYNVYAGFTNDLRYVLGLCIVNVLWCRNSDGFLTVFTFGIRCKVL